MVIDLLACGISPDKSILFIQSLVPEHTQLSWILGCYCPYGDLSRMTQFKEKLRQIYRHKANEFVSAGLFTYPVLQAADILMYRAEYVPVGKDQEQHIELSRSIARRLNHKFGPFFPEPTPLFTDTPKIMSLAEPSQNISKSLVPRHYIGLFENEQAIRDKIKAAVTDAGTVPQGIEMSPGVANLFNILKACGKRSEASEFMSAYASGKREYSALKEVVADALVGFTNKLKQKRSELFEDVVSVNAKVIEMSERARETARETLRAFYSLIELPIRY